MILEKRIERIYSYIQLATSQFPESKNGVTTAEIAEKLNIQRSNCSKDLNQLVKEGRLVKLSGRPVRYVLAKNHRQVAATFPSEKYVKSYKEQAVSPSPQPTSPANLSNNDKDIFKRIIGANGSMKNSVEQAKAAILYPPKGLNCLITGPTGSGKTYFAHAMFRFAKLNGIIAEEKELVVFNCADYAHNPELLMSHLFGYEKGAFTGAMEAKDGIIQQADGGMLFLDEIHRLPPEGQEMIFYFMDYGVYSRLGETTRNHHADVRIVGATTEDTSSVLLDTFVRRIPINIQMPSFSERPAREKIDLVKMMVALEAQRIQRRISLDKDVVKALIGSVVYGNIGQLKSNVQLVCARAFLNHMNQEEIVITIDTLPERIREGLIRLASERKAMMELSKILEPQMIVYPNESFVDIQTDSYELPYNLYDIIGDKAAILKADGLEQEAINDFIMTDINIHLESFYKNHGFTFNSEKKLSEFIDQRVLDFTYEIYELARNTLETDFQQNFIYAMSLHISSLLKRLYMNKERPTNTNIKEMATDFPEEHAVAQEIRHLMEEYFQVQVPISEAYYLTVLLVSLRKQQLSGRIGVVVAAHGKSTASSMVQVVQQLLEMDNVRAVDMPLEMHPRVAMEKIVAAIQEVSEGSGAMLLVDMGSLSSFTAEIEEQVGEPVRTIDMVTTPIVLETVRRTSLIGTDINDLYQALKNFRGYADATMMTPLDVSEDNGTKERAIVAICASGEGTAQRMKTFIKQQLGQQNTIKVFSISVVNLHEQLSKIQQAYQIVAVTGIIDPEIDTLYIPLEDFFNGQAEERLEQIRQETAILNREEIELTEEMARKVCFDYMGENFTFINPDKMLDPLWFFATEVAENYLSDSHNYSFYINLVMHMAGAIERTLRQDPLTLADENLAECIYEPQYKKIITSLRLLEETFHITFPRSERYFVVQLVDNTQTIH